VNARAATLLVAINALISAAFLVAYASWFAQGAAPTFALLDVGELYRLKEAQVTAVLMKRDASEEERVTALKHAAQFGHEVTNLIERLPAECRCLVLTRAAVIGPAPRLADLTPEVRRRLGL
jgi:hypothetical protein